MIRKNVQVRVEGKYRFTIFTGDIVEETDKTIKMVTEKDGTIELFKDNITSIKYSDLVLDKKFKTIKS